MLFVFEPLALAGRFGIFGVMILVLRNLREASRQAVAVVSQEFFTRPMMVSSMAGVLLSRFYGVFHLNHCISISRPSSKGHTLLLIPLLSQVD